MFLFGFHSILIFFRSASTSKPFLDSTFITTHFFPLSTAALVHSSPNKILSSSSSVTFSLCHSISNSSAISLIIHLDYTSHLTLLPKRQKVTLTPTSDCGTILASTGQGLESTQIILLGYKTLGTSVLELQCVLCWQTMIKTLSLGLGLLKVCLFVKLELSDCRIYWSKFGRLDQSDLVQIYLFAEFPIQPKHV